MEIQSSTYGVGETVTINCVGDVSYCESATVKIIAKVADIRITMTSHRYYRTNMSLSHKEHVDSVSSV